jgi:site-specific recombinase XerC
VQPLLEGHFALHDTLGLSVRTLQRIIRTIANRANISRKGSPHVLRHTFSVTAVQKESSTVLRSELAHDQAPNSTLGIHLDWKALGLGAAA